MRCMFWKFTWQKLGTQKLGVCSYSVKIGLRNCPVIQDGIKWIPLGLILRPQSCLTTKLFPFLVLSLFSTFALSSRISTYGFLDIVALLCLTVINGKKMTGRQPELLSDLDICCDFLFVCTLSWLILKSFFLIGQRNFAQDRWTIQRSVFEMRSAVATLLCAKNPNSPISHLKLHHQHQSDFLNQNNILNSGKAQIYS